MPLTIVRTAGTWAIILALVVVMLGAFTRLSNAGLGCPDWPGCYGHMVLPMEQNKLIQAQNQYPHTPIEASKAWTEMVHRYAAGSLGVLILFMVATVFSSSLKAQHSFKTQRPATCSRDPKFLLNEQTDFTSQEPREKYVAKRHNLKSQHTLSPYQPEKKAPRILPAFLVLMVIFQAALGMWTVTLQLLPVVVMGHLLGGIVIFACLCYWRWQLSAIPNQHLPAWRIWIGLGIVIVFIQIALGGWVSSNYAGISCIGFPQCNGKWWPTLHISQGFNLFSPVGANYQGGLLDGNARVTIQFVHRLGAYLTAAYVLGLSILIVFRSNARYLRHVALFAVLLVLIQFILGVVNVIEFLPLPAAVAHNGVAALLLAVMVSLFYLASGRIAHARAD